jgi:hypothetical protein
MSDLELTERRRFKGDKRWWARCNDFEFYPIKEHREWHRLYDFLEGAAWTLNWASDELYQMTGRKVFTYREDETTQDGKKVLSIKVVRRMSTTAAAFYHPNPGPKDSILPSETEEGTR